MNLKIFVYKTGKPLSEIRQIADKAIKEASLLGLDKDSIFIESTVASLLDMDEKEYSECIRELNRKFIESRYESFNDFIESLLTEEMVSTGFAPGDRPEKLVKPEPKKKEDEEAESEEK